MGLLSNKISRDELKHGDHIYSWRQSYLYAHHGIYVGDGKVIHFTRGLDQEIGSGIQCGSSYPSLPKIQCGSSYPSLPKIQCGSAYPSLPKIQCGSSYPSLPKIQCGSSYPSLPKIQCGSSYPSLPKIQCPQCGDQSMLNGVMCSCIDCFLYGGNLNLFGYNVSKFFFLAKTRGGTCTLAVSDPVDDVLQRASFLLENGFGSYHTFKNNCEDFAIYCKTGLLVNTNNSIRSGQAGTPLYVTAGALASSPLLLTTSFSGLAVVGYYGMYCLSRYKLDIGVRRDVSKVPVEELVTRFSPDELDGTAANVEEEK